MDNAQIPPKEEEFNIDFELKVSPDQKEATILLKSIQPLTSEDLVYVLEAWAQSMKKHFSGDSDAATSTNKT